MAMYTFKYMDYPTVVTDIQNLLGVDDELLPVEVITSLAVLPAAEMYAEIAAPSLFDNLGSLQAAKMTQLRLATVYFAAANAYPVVQTNLLQAEDDNKTKGQRFKDALASRSSQSLRSEGRLVLARITGAASIDVPQLTLSSPQTDIVTGN